jgi:transcriptional regulator with XRE-family HTH domain
MECETSSSVPVHDSQFSSTMQAALINAIRAERTRLRLTQVELAERLGWSRQTVNKIEAGERMVLAHELVDICGALDVTFAELMVKADPKDRRTLGL